LGVFTVCQLYQGIAVIFMIFVSVKRDRNWRYMPELFIMLSTGIILAMIIMVTTLIFNMKAIGYCWMKDYIFACILLQLGFLARLMISDKWFIKEIKKNYG
jgi:hypothetical protein